MMGDIRAMIREILSEEIAALRAGLAGAPQQETVRVDSSQDLTAFALSVLSRASDPAFAAALRSGTLTFTPVGPAQAVARPAPAAQPARLVASTPVSTPEINKSLITERDIAAIADDVGRVRIGKRSRMTPLAIDEARRRQIRVERSLQ